MDAKPLDIVLKELVSDLNIGPRLKTSLIFNHWEDIVGSQISQRSRPKRLKQGILFISVSSSTWANELDLMAGQLIEKINSYCGSRLVEGVRFKADFTP